MLVVFFQGCSTEKNSGVTRTYHNVTTRYNVLFNAKESYKSGIRKAERGKKDDYTQMLPLFLYDDIALAQLIAGDMEAAAKKATKAINLHSIKVKPKVGKKGMSPAERIFFNKREYNKHINECYLIIGKSYIYTNQYYMALQTFNFMETEFAEEPILYEVKLWKAKALLLDKTITEAGRVLNELIEDKDFPKDKSLRSELYATVADWYIKQNRYANAIDYLNIAIENTKNKRRKIRFRYVLAQLHLELKEYQQAADMFQKVIRMNPPYELSFNATIQRATASKDGGAADVSDVKKQLHKMLRDSKNTEYQDQIYYTLAEIELYEGNTEKAIEYFQKSAKASSLNLPQKTKSYLTLANLFYDRREYVPSQAYYDSAMVNMQPSYLGYAQISSRAKNLNDLVNNLNKVQFQDSVQRIAKMSESERNRLISGIIAELKNKEQKQKEAEAFRMQQYYANMGRRSTLPDATAKSMWYFYNPQMVTQGMGEFEMKWGRRNLEDNWRRKNKGTSEMSMIADNTGAGEEEGAKKIQDIYTPEYYIQDLPLTDSMMLISHHIIEESLYAAGYIYNNDFAEYALAAGQYEELIKRYPQSDYIIPAYYYLYQLYNKTGKTAEAEKYKNRILENAPESVHAKLINDPDYLNKLAQLTGESEQLYEQAYNQFNTGEYRSALELASNALEKFPNDVLAPKFTYLKALSTGKIAGTNDVMREEMRTITTNYPGTELALAAQNLIDFIDGETPELKQQEQVELAKSLYTYNIDEKHYFVWYVDRKENINQLWFDVQNFHSEHFINDRLFFERIDINPQQGIMLVTRGFSDFQHAHRFYEKFLSEPEAKKNILYQYSNFLISESNYAILEEDGNIEIYIEFFKKEYE